MQVANSVVSGWSGLFKQSAKVNFSTFFTEFLNLVLLWLTFDFAGHIEAVIVLLCWGWCSTSLPSSWHFCGCEIWPTRSWFMWHFGWWVLEVWNVFKFSFWKLVWLGASNTIRRIKADFSPVWHLSCWTVQYNQCSVELVTSLLYFRIFAARGTHRICFTGLPEEPQRLWYFQ